MGIFLSSFNKSRAPACKKEKETVNLVAMGCFKNSINNILLCALKVPDWIQTISSQFIHGTILGQGMFCFTN